MFSPHEAILTFLTRSASFHSFGLMMRISYHFGNQESGNSITLSYGFQWNLETGFTS